MGSCVPRCSALHSPPPSPSPPTSKNDLARVGRGSVRACRSIASAHKPIPGPAHAHAVLWTRMLASDTPSAPKYVQPADAHVGPSVLSASPQRLTAPLSRSFILGPPRPRHRASSLVSHAQTPQHPPHEHHEQRYQLIFGTPPLRRSLPSSRTDTSRAGQRWGLSSRCKSSRRTEARSENRHIRLIVSAGGRSHTDRDVAYARSAAPSVPPAHEHELFFVPTAQR
jgi:hypothetical protein